MCVFVVPKIGAMFGVFSKDFPQFVNLEGVNWKRWVRTACENSAAFMGAGRYRSAIFGKLGRIGHHQLY